MTASRTSCRLASRLKTVPGTLAQSPCCSSSPSRSSIPASAHTLLRNTRTTRSSYNSIMSSCACSQRRTFKLPDLSQFSPFAASSPSQSKVNSQTGATSGEGQNGLESDAPAGADSVSESVVLPYTSQELHALVEDVSSYSIYVPLCTSSSILGPADASPTDPPNSKAFMARLSVGFKGLEESYVSRVVSVPGQSVEATAQSDLFKYLRTRWTFTPLPSDPTRTKVDFHVSFLFRDRLHALLSGRILERMAPDMIRAFSDRAKAIYAA